MVGTFVGPAPTPARVPWAPVAYEIWDESSGNMLGSWETEREALNLVDELFQTDGPAAVEGLVLAHEDGAGHTMSLGDGMGLLERARRQRP
jgi:hypothetical protein